MTRTMGDSARGPAAIPQTVDIVALYRNGRFPADPALAARRFPAKAVVTVWIDVNGTAPKTCQVLDVEKGDASPSAAPAWIRARRAAVHTSLPTIYCDRSTYPDVVKACSAAGLLPGAHYQFWISTLDGTETMKGVPLARTLGVVACQFKGGMTAAWDESVVYDPDWHPLAA